MTVKDILRRFSDEKSIGYAENEGFSLREEPSSVTSGLLERWTAAIRDNDALSADVILGQLSTQQQETLLKSTSVESGSDPKVHFVVTSPWCLAGVCSSMDVMAVLLKYDIDVLQMSGSDGNVVHCLVRAARHGGGLGVGAEEAAVRVYTWLVEQVPHSALRELLTAEDGEQLRPLELAAFLCTLHLADTIFNTDGVYRHVVNRGLYRDEFFDVSDYETVSSQGRRKRSPLFMLIASPYLADKSTNATLFSKGPVRAWIGAKVNSNLFFVFMWFLSRLVYMSVFILVDIVQQSSKHKDPILRNSSLVALFGSVACNKPHIDMSFSLISIQVGFLLVCSVFIILHVLFHAACDLRNCIVRYSSKSALPHWTYPSCLDTFDFFQFVTACTTMTYGVLLLVGRSQYVWDDTTQQVLVLVNMPLFFLELLQFTIFFPRIGHFALVLQHMIRDLAFFLAFFSGFMLCESYVLQRIIDFCPAELNNFLYIFYQCVLVLLTSNDLSQFTSGSTVKEIWHLSYIVFGSLMLFNFLIALFTQTFTHIAADRARMLTAARVCIVFKLEFVLAPVAKCWYRAVHRRTFYTLNNQHHQPGGDDNEHRVYIKITSFAP